MSDTNLHMPEARFKAMWRKIDVDSSGAIDESEFVKALEPYMNKIREHGIRGDSHERSDSSQERSSQERGISADRTDDM